MDFWSCSPSICIQLQYQRSKIEQQKKVIPIYNTGAVCLCGFAGNLACDFVVEVLKYQVKNENNTTTETNSNWSHNRKELEGHYVVVISLWSIKQWIFISTDNRSPIKALLNYVEEIKFATQQVLLKTRNIEGKKGSLFVRFTAGFCMYILYIYNISASVFLMHRFFFVSF